jgi:hypothetical protein
MARTPASASASRIRIEEEVWEEAFSSRIGTGRSRTGSRAVAAPVRAAGPSRSAASPRAASPAQSGEPPRLHVADPRYDLPAEGGRRTIRIEGRGADPMRARTRDRSAYSAPSAPRAMGGSPDRLAMWATLLGFLLVLVAILSSHF